MRSFLVLAVVCACSAPATIPPKDACAYQLRAELTPMREGQLLSLTVENLSSAAVALELPDRCPAGPIEVEGLPATYDLYGTCNKGACAGPRSPQRISLAPGEHRVVATAVIDPSGDAPCTTLLAPGRYELKPVAPAGPKACVVPASLDVAAAGDPYACTAPSDCVLACPTAPGCCGDTCGCRHAMRRDRADAYVAAFAATCEKPPCPAMGCEYRPAAGATCRAGRCVATDGPGG